MKVTNGVIKKKHPTQGVGCERLIKLICLKRLLLVQPEMLTFIILTAFKTLDTSTFLEIRIFLNFIEFQLIWVKSGSK